MKFKPTHKVSRAQWDVLIKFMQNHRDLALGSSQQTPEARLRASTLWKKVAVRCNKVQGGAKKDGKKWAKTWADKKSALKQRIKTENKAANTIIDDNGFLHSKFPDYEEKIIEVTGLAPGRPQCQGVPTSFTEVSIVDQEDILASSPAIDDIKTSPKDSSESEMSDTETRISPVPEVTPDRVIRRQKTRPGCRSIYYERLCQLEEKRLYIHERGVAMMEQRNKQYAKMIKNIEKITASALLQTESLTKLVKLKMGQHK